MFTAAQSHFSFYVKAHHGYNGEISYCSTGDYGFVNYGDDLKYWEKELARMARRQWYAAYMNDAMMIHVALEKKNFIMQIDIVAKQQTIETRNKIHDLAIALHKDWFENGAISNDLVEQMAQIANL